MTPNDGEAPAGRILELASNRALCSEMGTRVREAFETHWDKSHGLAKWGAALVEARRQRGGAMRLL